MKYICVLALLTAGMARAADPVPDDVMKAPEKVTVREGRRVVVRVTCKTEVTWINLDPDNLDVDDYLPGSVMVGGEVGKYVLIAACASGGKVSYVRIAVEVVSRDPKPDPKPRPDPVPVDPLTKAITDAFGLDGGGADKVAYARSLAAVYRKGVDSVTSDMTSARLLADLRAVTEAMKVPAEAIPLTRSRIGLELKKVLPAAGQLTDEQQKAVKALFLKIATGLEACK